MKNLNLITKKKLEYINLKILSCYAIQMFHCLYMTMLQARSRNMALGSTQSLTEMGTRNLPGGKGWLVHMADNLTNTCEPAI
jgi:hypothetical protein